MNVTLPSILFPAISLLFLAYTNRFLALTTVSRNLLKEFKAKPTQDLVDQLHQLRTRMNLIRRMQLWGLISIISATLSIGAVLYGQALYGTWVFGFALFAFIYSLIICIKEIDLSIQAIVIAADAVALPPPGTKITPTAQKPSPELVAQCLHALKSDPATCEWVNKEAILPGGGGLLVSWCRLAEDYATQILRQQNTK